MKNIDWDNPKIKEAINSVMNRFYNKELNSCQVEKEFYNETGHRLCYLTIRKHYIGEGSEKAE